MIRPGDTVTLTATWDSIVVPNPSVAQWLNDNAWAVRAHQPVLPTIDVLARAYPQRWAQVRDGSWVEVRAEDGTTTQLFVGSGHVAAALVRAHNAVLEFP